jgi:hypothetical protein
LSRVLVLVEGQTEETFIRDVLTVHLAPFEIHPTPVLVSTKRSKSGLKFKGGIRHYQKVRRDLSNLLHDRGAVAVTTMIDYYGVPEDFPGLSTQPSGGSCYQRVDYLERALAADLGDSRLLPYLSLHEFEALLFTSPPEIQSAFPNFPVEAPLGAALRLAGSPEEINDGPDTHPSARLEKLLPTYQKTLHGPILAGRIGLEALCERCSHFAAWVRRLESLGPRFGELPAKPGGDEEGPRGT